MGAQRGLAFEERRSMTRFRWAMVWLLALCAAPLVMALLAAGLANGLGCTLHEGFPNPCKVGGIDIGGALYAMGVSGWLMLATLPIGSLLILVWIVVEVIRYIRQRRSAP
jgi:hypothetical protein